MKFECDKCALKRHQCALMGEGPETADIMIIGQCPNAKEKKTETIFAGSNGRKVSEALASVGLTRSDVYLTNIVKCFSPPGRQLSKTYIRICSKEHLVKEIEKVKPKVILALGAKACSFFDTKFIANSYFYDDKLGCQVVVTHHPARLLRSYSDKLHKEFKEAFATAHKLLTVTKSTEPKLDVLYAEDPTLDDLNKLDNVIALDIETTGLNFLTDSVISIGLSDGQTSIAVPVYDKVEKTVITSKVDMLNQWIQTRKVIGHNIKFDYKFLKKVGIEINVVFDTMLAHFLIDREAPHGLSEISLKYLHTNLTKGTIDFDHDAIDVKERAVYAANDAWMTYKIYQIMQPEIKARFDKVYYSIMIPTLVWLAEAEYKGVKVDREYVMGNVSTLKYKLQSLISDVENDTIVKDYCTAKGLTFNIKSSVQLKGLIYEYLGCKSRTGNTAEATLEYLASKYKKYEFLKKIVEYRHVYKTYKTYLRNLLDYSEHDGRIHCQYNQARVPTGRLSCSSPNLQNIPKDGELATIVRKAFVAEEGYILVEADFKQAEFRSLAHYSRDPYMLQLIEDGKDIHRMIASVSYLKKEEDITSHERTVAKTIVFGMMYGRGAKSISEQLGIPLEEAENIKSNFFKMFKQAAKWIKGVQKFAKYNGYVKTLTGRKITLPQVYSRDEAIASKAMRCSVNYPIQSTAADLTNLSGALVYKELREKKLDAHVIMNIHDAVIVECKKEILDEVKDIIKKAMTEQVKRLLGFRAELEIDTQSGPNLAEHD